jgi:Fe-S-cluster containining protein
MALEFLGSLFGSRNRLPSDQVTRVPRSAKKAAASAITGMQEALDKIAAMPGIADIEKTKRVPRGFYAEVEKFYEHLDAYHAEARKHLPIAEDSKRPGEPGGTAACYAAPMPVHAVEHLNIYRKVRTWKDFQPIAQRLGELGEQVFKDIQAGHSGKDPEKIRMGGKAVRNGRLSFAKRMEPCPYLDQGKDRCRIWDQRPLVCRMHFPATPDDSIAPDAEGYPSAVKAKNVRLPVKAQVAMQQLDKRMSLNLSPFLYAGVLQLLQLADGQMIQEVGEAPQKMQQDGQIVQKANRNVKHAKKFQKRKKGKKGKRRK